MSLLLLLSQPQFIHIEGKEHGCLRSNISTRIVVFATIAYVARSSARKKKEGNIEAWIHARIHARRNEMHQHWPRDKQSGERKYGGDGVMMMVLLMVMVVEDTFV